MLHCVPQNCISFVVYWFCLCFWINLYHLYMELKISWFDGAVVLGSYGSLNLADGKVYLIQHYVIKFVSDLQQVCAFLRCPPTNKTGHHDILVTEILLKVVLNNILPLVWMNKNCPLLKCPNQWVKIHEGIILTEPITLSHIDWRVYNNTIRFNMYNKISFGCKHETKSIICNWMQL